MASQAPVMEFKKGDSQTHYFQLPIDSWVPGGLLWFTAKPAIDNDNSDTAAVINKSFDDSKVVLDDDDAYEVGFATYKLEFVAADMINVNFVDGAKKNKYLGEFEIVSGTGDHETYPSDDNYIDVIIFADVKRGGA